MKLSLHNVWHVAKNIKQRKALKKGIEQEIKEEILSQCFDNDSNALNNFLKSNHKYEIIGSQAAFYSSQLKGYLGNHS